MECVRILIVEDEAIVAFDIERSLMTLDYSVTAVVSSGSEAIQAVAQDPPDLVIMDIHLEGSKMDGIEAAEYIRQHYKIPIVFLTAFVDEALLKRAKATGPYGYILKPFHKNELQTAIDIACYKYHVESELRETNRQLEQEIKIRKEIEQVLQNAKEEAEASNRAKSEFLANISHELRTPLNGILGYAQILKHDKRLFDDQREKVEGMYRSGRHLLTLINDILDLSKIEEGKLELHPLDFNVRDFLQDLTNMHQMKAQQKEITVYCDIHPDVPHYVHGDERALRQVLFNLLGNAVKFTENGQVTFRVCRTRCSDSSSHAAQTATTNLRFEIEDTGIGIHPDQLQKIFDPFQQVGETRYCSEGTGLGLAISQRLVHLMGSQLHVRSAPGEGSTFWFDVHLPVVKRQRMREKYSSAEILSFKETGATPASRPYTIVIADDNDENRLLLRHLLEPLGFHIREAANGREVLALIQECQPDVILMDLIMPEIDGYEATMLIRQEEANTQPERRPIPIIAMSTYRSEHTLHKYLAAGGNDFLLKPITLDILADRFEQLLPIEWVYEQSSESFPAWEETRSGVLPPPPQPGNLKSCMN